MTSESYEGAPIVHLFGAPSPASLNPRSLSVAKEDEEPMPKAVPDRQALAAEASDALVKKLSRKQLSSKEAHTFVVDLLTDPEAETPLDRYDAQEIADQIVVEFEQRLYLNDAGLAEVLAETLQNRKAVGRGVLIRELGMRGISREHIDAALSGDRDEEAERALEFARDRARRLDREDEQTAVRRLYGQLARRGYSGNIALTAAKTAVRESRGSASSRRGRVTFS